MNNQPLAEPEIYRGSRCGICYWALYDGDWCQNPDCSMRHKSVGENRVRLTNAEAAILIKHSQPPAAPEHDDIDPVTGYRYDQEIPEPICEMKQLPAATPMPPGESPHQKAEPGQPGQPDA